MIITAIPKNWEYGIFINSINYNNVIGSILGRIFSIGGENNIIYVRNKTVEISIIYTKVTILSKSL